MKPDNDQHVGKGDANGMEGSREKLLCTLSNEISAAALMRKLLTISTSNLQCLSYNSW